jgi:4-hydroxybenzoate polyprenyltransferase
VKKHKFFLKKRIIEFIFFGNYFYAVCALSLAIESSLQQSIGLNKFVFYLLITSATIVYYTYAYMGEISFRIAFGEKKIKLTPPKKYNYYNKRTEWYQRNDRLLNITQSFFLFVSMVCALDLAVLEYHHIFSLHLSEWLMLLSVPVVALLYYGNSFFPVFAINLRKTGWVKPFVVGFVWAGAVTIYPPMFHQWQNDLHYSFSFLVFWLFVKNWMYISVLAIMFDIKDYADDANRDLKTFVVRVGLRKTIFMILLPLIIIGLIAFSIFAFELSFSIPRYLVNLIPFLLLLAVAYSMHRRRPILFYLIIIDGLMLVKGIAGIIGAVLFSRA